MCSEEFKESITKSVDELIARLNDMVFHCRMDERMIPDEMLHFIETISVSSRNETAYAILHFLEDKYDTKKWLVITISESDVKSGSIHTARSGGFHTASANGMFTLAISNGAHTSDELVSLSTLQRSFLHEFKIPYHAEEPNWYSILIAHERTQVEATHDYLERYLTPLRNDTKFELETLVMTRPVDCGNSDKQLYGTIASSNGFDYFRKDHKSCPCARRKSTAIVIPKRPSWKSDPVITNTDSNCFAKSGMLRNAFSQGYLSVVNDPKEMHDTRAILDRQWRNSPGQKWQFVNGQLRNGHDYCLTIEPNNSTLYQNSCNCVTDWPNEKWVRHGLQIAWPINGSMACVAVDDALQPVLDDKCQTNARYLWHDWDVDCEDAVVIHVTPGSGRPLRNDLSKRFLTASGNNDQMELKTWMNLSEQRWRFVDGQLINDDGVCLAGKGRSIRKEICANSKKRKENRWKYKKNKQIVSDEGYCLVLGDEMQSVNYLKSFAEQYESSAKLFDATACYIDHLRHRYLDPKFVPKTRIPLGKGGLGDGVYYDECKDVPEQRWTLL